MNYDEKNNTKTSKRIWIRSIRKSYLDMTFKIMLTMFSKRLIRTTCLIEIANTTFEFLATVLIKIHQMENIVARPITLLKPRNRRSAFTIKPRRHSAPCPVHAHFPQCKRLLQLYYRAALL